MADIGQATDHTYVSTAVFSEMLNGFEVVRNFDWRTAEPIRDAIERNNGNVTFVGIGSSVLFPFNNMLYLSGLQSPSNRYNLRAMQGAQAAAACHEGTSLVYVSNSGWTGEVVNHAEESWKNKGMTICLL